MRGEGFEDGLWDRGFFGLGWALLVLFLVIVFVLLVSFLSVFLRRCAGMGCGRACARLGVAVSVVFLFFVYRRLLSMALHFALLAAFFSFPFWAFWILELLRS